MELPVTPGAVFADALLAALADNGGPTRTLALQADSDHVSAATVLCPGGHPQAGVFDLRMLLRYPDVLSLARTRAAQLSVLQDPEA